MEQHETIKILISTLEWYRIRTKNSTTQVRTSAGVSKSFEVSVGAHQGSARRPFLFTVIKDSMSEELRKEVPWNMLFADDVVIYAPELERSRGSIGRVEESS